MDLSELLRWRLDAWDSRAGRAFLCRRFPDDGEDPRLDQPTAFVCPPFFEPEPLASRAPGLAATRGTAQAGFFIDGEEVGFTTLADAIAYVRRAYNSPGSDFFPGAPIIRRVGPTGRGGSGLARELPELPTTTAYRELNLAIATCKEGFQKSAAVGLGSAATPFQWHVDEKLTVQTIGLLDLAGEALVREMIWRFPPKGMVADYSAWLDAAHRLGRQLMRLGLWDRVKDRCAAQLKLPIEDIHKAFAIGVPDAILKDLHGDPMQRFVEALFAYPTRVLMALERTDEATIYDDLGQFPLPPSIASSYPARADRVPTVLTLLSTWFAHPNSVAGATTLDRALFLFGGACVIVGRLQRESPAFKPWWINQNPSVRQSFDARLGEETWKWLSKQLPDRAFDRRLEETLRDVSRVWMKIGTIGPSDMIYFKPILGMTEEEVAALYNSLGEILTEGESVYWHEADAEEEVDAEKQTQAVQLES